MTPCAGETVKDGINARRSCVRGDSVHDSLRPCELCNNDHVSVSCWPACRRRRRFKLNSGRPDDDDDGVDFYCSPACRRRRRYKLNTGRGRADNDDDGVDFYCSPACRRRPHYKLNSGRGFRDVYRSSCSYCSSRSCERTGPDRRNQQETGER